MRANRYIGRQVAGRFTIKSFLGEGGMATVFVAEQPTEPHQVALKIMNDDLTADRSFVKRFQREAKAAARVQHPNSVAIIDYGVAEGISYIAMELLAGEDLYALLERDGAITQGRAARILVEVCDALMVAHELGIVHRDLKPENIMVIPDPAAPSGERVKVLDFGIAKLLAPDTSAPVDPRLDPASQVTRAGTFIGTPAYMSPEQCALLPVDTRADIYTCGVLLFQLCTGRLPFEGQTPLHTATLHIHEPAPRPSSYAPTMDPRLEAVITKALAKRPTDRHQTARHLATTLRKLLVDLPDVRVAKLGKPVAGSMRPRGSSASTAPRPAAGIPGADVEMDSARTMVADPTAGGDAAATPPSVVVRAPTSDPAADSSPARVRPPMSHPTDHPTAVRAGIGFPPPPMPPSIPGAMSDDDPSSDGDDFNRTLVRAPIEDILQQAAAKAAEEAPPRFGPQRTEVILPSAAPGAIAAALAAPGPVDIRASNMGDPPRAFTPTLKSAGGPIEPEVLKKAPAEGVEPPPSSIVVTPAAFAETAKVETFDPSMLVVPPNVSGTAQTVPLISPATVAAAIAMATANRPGATTLPVLIPPGTAPSPQAPRTSPTLNNAGPPSGLITPPSEVGPVSLASLPEPSAVLPVTNPAVATELMLTPPPMAALPQTPPIYPLAPQPEPAPSAISGPRGLLIGFLAGAVLMGLAALVYFLVAPR